MGFTGDIYFAAGYFDQIGGFRAAIELGGIYVELFWIETADLVENVSLALREWLVKFVECQGNGLIVSSFDGDEFVELFQCGS